MMPKGLMQFQLGIKRVINYTTLISASNTNISKSKRKNEFEKKHWIQLLQVTLPSNICGMVESSFSVFYRNKK